MKQTLITTGLLCVIAGIVGGGLTLFSSTLPVISSWRRQLLLGLFGAVLIVVALNVSGDDPNRSPADSAAPAAPQTDPAALTAERARPSPDAALDALARRLVDPTVSCDSGAPIASIPSTTDLSIEAPEPESTIQSTPVTVSGTAQLAAGQHLTVVSYDAASCNYYFVAGYVEFGPDGKSWSTRAYPTGRARGAICVLRVNDHGWDLIKRVWRFFEERGDDDNRHITRFPDGTDHAQVPVTLGLPG